MSIPKSLGLLACAEHLVAAAQAVLDDWEQDADWIDPELGAGGACQDIASALSQALADLGVEEIAETFTEFDGGHVFLIANLSDGVFRIDIPPGVYETGAGYVWRKREGIRLSPEDLIFDRIDAPMSSRDFRVKYAEEPEAEMAFF